MQVVAVANLTMPYRTAADDDADEDNHDDDDNDDIVFRAAMTLVGWCDAARRITAAFGREARRPAVLRVLLASILAASPSAA